MINANLKSNIVSLMVPYSVLGRAFVLRRDRLSLSVDSPKYAYPIGNKGTERDSEGVGCQFHKSYLQIGF